MARILVLQHSPYEPLGLIIHTLKRMKFRIRYVNFARDPNQRVDISRYHGIVVLGGAMHPSEINQYPHLAHEIELLKAAVAKEIPVLGICLGSQLLNIAMGGNCYALEKPELGWTMVEKTSEHELFGLFDEPLHVFQWHQYASELTSNAKILLKNDQCVQAFCYHQNCIGLQFHLEVDESLIERWLEHPDYLEHLRLHLDQNDINLIRNTSKLYLENSMAVAKQFFADFCRLFDKKTFTLSSKKSGGELY